MKIAPVVLLSLATGLGLRLGAQPSVPPPAGSSPVEKPAAIADSRRTGCAVLHEVTGPMKTNAYLLYDRVSREAALFDAGGTIESLTSAIDQRGLRLKYIFATHGHVDHVQGIPALRARYPEARWCISKMEFEAMALYARWETALAADEVARIKVGMAKDTALAETMNFDFARLGRPDDFIDDGQVFWLGNVAIRTFLCPGHSRGSICFLAGDALFSGDVLFYLRVGRTDLPESGGRPAMESSVRRLYAMLQEETTVYPGHGHFTEIGIEKLFNAQVKVDPGAR